MGGFVAGGGHGPAGDGRPGIAVVSEAGVQAIANSLGVLKCLCCGGRYVAVTKNTVF